MKKARIDPVVMVLDVVGFILIVLGGVVIRYAREEPLSILGGLVMAVGVTVLSVTRWVRT